MRHERVRLGALARMWRHKVRGEHELCGARWHQFARLKQVSTHPANGFVIHLDDLRAPHTLGEMGGGRKQGTSEQGASRERASCESPGRQRACMTAPRAPVSSCRLQSSLAHGRAAHLAAAPTGAEGGHTTRRRSRPRRDPIPLSRRRCSDRRLSGCRRQRPHPRHSQPPHRLHQRCPPRRQRQQDRRRLPRAPRPRCATPTRR